MTTTRPGGEPTGEPSTRELYRSAFGAEAPRASWNEARTGGAVLLLGVAGLAFSQGRRSAGDGDEAS